MDKENKVLILTNKTLLINSMIIKMMIYSISKTQRQDSQRIVKELQQTRSQMLNSLNKPPIRFNWKIVIVLKHKKEWIF